MPPPPSKRNTAEIKAVIPPAPPKKGTGEGGKSEGGNPFATEENQYAGERAGEGAAIAGQAASAGNTQPPAIIAEEEEAEEAGEAVADEATDNEAAGGGAQGGQDVVVALYSHDGEDADDLSFKEGDKIIVLAKDESGWYTGQLVGTDFVGIVSQAQRG